MKQIHEADFEAEVLNSNIPVLVDFYADWCGPCRALAPALQALDDEAAGRYKIVKVNTDEDADLATRYGISALPTLILFKDGQPAKTTRGLQQLESLRRFVDGT